MILSVLLAVHLLCAAVWVGGMAFALLVLRPSVSVLAPEQRLALHGEVFRRFFRIVWHAMPLLLLSGYAMLFGVFGGFAGANWAIHTMHLLGLVMAAVFVAIFFGPWARLRAGEAGSVDTIRKLIAVNLVLGLVTVAVAAFG